MGIFTRLKKIRFDRRGSSTIEYVIVLAAAAMLGMILMTTVESQEIQNALKEKIECVITQECHQTQVASDEKEEEDSSGYLPDRLTHPQENNFTQGDPYLQPLNYDDYEWKTSLKQTSNKEDSDKKESSWWDSFWDKDPDQSWWDWLWEKDGEIAELTPWTRAEQEAKEDGNWLKYFLQSSHPVLGFLSPILEEITGFDLVDWMIENPGTVALNLAGIGLIFVPGGQGAGATLLTNTARTMGWGIVGGSGFGGITAGLMGGDVSEGILYGGLAGSVGGLVGRAFYSGAGNLVSRFGGPLLQRWLPTSLGGTGGAFADMISFDWLTEGKVNWKKAGITSLIIGGLTFGGGAFIDKAGPGIGSVMNKLGNQLGINLNVGGDGTLAMPWFGKNVDEAAEGYNKASGKGGGTQAPFKANKPPRLQAGDPNFSFRTEVDPKTKKLVAHTSDGRTFNVHFGEKRNTVETQTTKQGNTYTVHYDKDAFPDFTPYAIKDKNERLLEVSLPTDALVGSSADQTRYATQLLKEKYPNWRTEFGFTDSQITAIEKNKGPIGPGLKVDPAEHLTWHHDKETGKMILVPYDLNNSFDHTGGHRFWGKQKPKK